MTTSVVRSLFLCLWVTPSTSDTGRLHTKERLRHSGGAWCDPTFGRGVVPPHACSAKKNPHALLPNLMQTKKENKEQ